MADVPDLNLLVVVEDEVGGEEDNLMPASYWSNDFLNHEIYASDVDPFSPQGSQPSGMLPSEQSGHAQVVVDGVEVDELESCLPIEERDGLDSEFVTDDHLNFVIDLFGSRVEQSHAIYSYGSSSNPFSERLGDSNRPDVEGNGDLGSNSLELGLGLDLGLGFDGRVNEDQTGGFMIEDSGDEFFFTRRASVSGSGEISTLHDAGGQSGEGLLIEGFGSDLAEEDEIMSGIDLNPEDDDGLDRVPDDLGPPPFWDFLRLGDQRNTNEDIDWEEVDNRLDEREVLNTVADAEEMSVSTEFHFEEEADHFSFEREETMRNLEWFFLIVNNLEDLPEIEPDALPYLADHENENSTTPAGKSAVQNLPLIFLTQLDVQNNNVICAVCTDEISMKEPVKRLPCTHHYHVDCIIPWLSIRNTCPVCRFELPTDDPNYE